jgi:sporulation protein YpjB
MKKIIAFLIAVFLLVAPTRIYAADWSELNRLLDESLQLVKQEEYTKAERILTYFSTEFADLNKKEDFSAEHTRVISIAYDKAVQAMREETMSQKEKEDDVTALRLVVDAESSQFQPLWLSRENTIMSAFSQMETAVQKQDDEQFQRTLNTFLYEFDIIYPSLVVDLPKEEIERLNAHLSYLDEFRNVMAKNESGQKQMQVIRQDLETVFQSPNKDEATPSLIWVMISTGSIIIFTLTYVAWRKDKGDQEKRNTRMKSQNR